MEAEGERRRGGVDIASKRKITTGPRERGIGPPQAAWRGAVERPSGGPSAPGRRCWRLGRKRPSPFSNSGPTPLRSDPNLGAMKFKVLLRKRGGARARACGRRARSCKHNDVGKLCIKYTVGSKHGTRARSILSAPCKRVAIGTSRSTWWHCGALGFAPFRLCFSTRLPRPCFAALAAACQSTLGACDTGAQITRRNACRAASRSHTTS